MVEQGERSEPVVEPSNHGTALTGYDEVVVPYTSDFLARGPRTTNVTLQNVCPLNLAGHLTIPLSQPSLRITLDALTHDGPARRTFRPACV